MGAARLEAARVKVVGVVLVEAVKVVAVGDGGGLGGEVGGWGGERGGGKGDLSTKTWGFGFSKFSCLKI